MAVVEIGNNLTAVLMVVTIAGAWVIERWVTK